MTLGKSEWQVYLTTVKILAGAAFQPGTLESAQFVDQELVLLRFHWPIKPHFFHLIFWICFKTRIEHNQRRTTQEVFTSDANDGMDPITHDELQYGGLKCRILGTFYLSDGHLRLGSDLENYVSSTRLRVFKPRGKALGLIVNHTNPEVRSKALEEAKRSGFSKLPTPY